MNAADRYRFNVREALAQLRGLVLQMIFVLIVLAIAADAFRDYP